MTAVAEASFAATRSGPLAQAGVFRTVLIVALAGVALMSLPNLLDPMIRHDDYPALFAEPELFWNKTLHEGRWLNYVWHLRELVTPAWLNFAVYQAFWAVFAAAVATLAVGRGAARWFAVVLALAILVAPPASLIALWFNTLLPGLGLVALFAVLALWLPVVWQRVLLVPFVVASFMAYTTYPLLLLIVCLLRTERRSIADLVLLLGLFVASFALAVLATYGLNWQVHGVFGVPLADWRAATPAGDLSGLVANLSVLQESLANFLRKSSFESTPTMVFHLAMFAAATAVLARRAPLEALYLHAGLWTGIGLVAAQATKLGVIVPPRAFVFAWVIYVVMVARAAEVLSDKPGLPGRMARNLLLLIVGSYLLQTFQQFAVYRDWQSETREIAAALPVAETPLLVPVDVLDSPAARAAFIQSDNALRFRIRQLTHREVGLCVAANSPRRGADAGDPGQPALPPC